MGKSSVMYEERLNAMTMEKIGTQTTTCRVHSFLTIALRVLHNPQRIRLVAFPTYPHSILPKLRL
jgi:hypothetical protein